LLREKSDLLQRQDVMAQEFVDKNGSAVIIIAPAFRSAMPAKAAVIPPSVFVALLISH
jgi:hypothetical protein